MKITNDTELLNSLLRAQQDEVDSYEIYSRLAKKQQEGNKEILLRIAGDEKRHAEMLEKHTQKKVRPNFFKIRIFQFLGVVFGVTFTLKLLEKAEEQAQVDYGLLKTHIPELELFIQDEDEHEMKLLNMINEERLEYMGSVVLGLNDALVELTGTLAGLTFAFQNTKLIALSGFITGIAASLSMAVSEYLSTKTEGRDDALKSSLYTGSAYVATVVLLILPYVFIKNYYICLGMTMAVALLIILSFNFYISVAKNYNFKKRFWEMALLSLGVAAISFLIGFAIRTFIGIDV